MFMAKPKSLQEMPKTSAMFGTFSPLLQRCDLYGLTFVRRQDAAKGHSN